MRLEGATGVVVVVVEEEEEEEGTMETWHRG
jgi:hypothetical protein